MTINEAGAVVFRMHRGRPVYLVITAKENLAHWVLPKGHIEPGELPEHAALRELVEETGVEGTIVQALGENTFEYQDKSIRVRFFLVRHTKSAAAVESRHQCWLSYRAARKQLTFEDTRRVLDAASDHLRTIGQHM